ncbi:MAG: flagellar biosynthesis protein [Paracoccaceae bacterium]
MSQLLTLEEFSALQITSVENFTANIDLDSEKIQESLDSVAFEKGYKAGWTDACSAEKADQTRISAEFARNLQDLGFTFHEARNQVLKSLEHFLTELIEKILPKIAHETLGLVIIDEIVPMAEEAANAPLQVVISPLTRPAIEPLLEGFSTIDLELVEETSLSSGQVFLRVGPAEKQIDFSKIFEATSTALAAMYQTNERALKHG